MVDRPVVADEAEYAHAVEALSAGTGPIAVDAERASGYRYSQRAYLIQMFRRGSGTFLFDPPALGRLDALNAAIADEEWVLHAASQDLACLREVGLDPHEVFDTELGSRLLGLPKVGLGTVVEDLLGVHLAKQHSAVDWSTRPLPGPWLEYAALDVELLVDLRDRVESLLREAGKDEIAHQEFDAELHRPPKAPRAEPWRRLSGIHSVKGARSLAVARELWLARDGLARERDVAPGRLVPDSSILAAAKALPGSKRELSGLRSFSGRASRGEIERWWAAIEAGLATEELPTLRRPSDALPPVRSWRERHPEAHARLRAARDRMQEISERERIPVENLLTPEYLRRLAWDPPTADGAGALDRRLVELGARPWQREATLEAIAEAFAEAQEEAVAGDAADES